MDPPANADQMPTVDAVLRAQAQRLGLEPLLDAWSLESAPSAEAVARFIATVHTLLARGVDFFETVAALKGPALTDIDRLVAVLRACARPESRADALDMATLRLAADTAVNDEFAARCYVALAELTPGRPMESAQALNAGLQRVLHGGSASLQGTCLLGLARSAVALERFVDAADHAELARIVWSRVGDATQAQAAALVEAFARCENGQWAEAAVLLRPVLVRQQRGGVAAGEADAAAVMARCVARAARAAFELAQRGDPQAGASYDDAVALAGDTGWHAPGEADDRWLIGRALWSAGQAEVALDQIEKASRLGHSPLLAPLVLQLLALGHTGWAQRLAERLPHDAADSFEARAQVALAVAAAQSMGGAHEALEPAMQVLADEAQARGDLGIELAARYTLAESRLVAGSHQQALIDFQAIVDRARGREPTIQAAALNKLGTTWALLGQPAMGLGPQREALQLQRQLGNGPGIVVALIEAAQSCLALGRLDDARTYADEIETLGPLHPPADVEWIAMVPARVAAKQGRWPQAKALFLRALTELERKRAQFVDAESQRRWALAKADFHGQAIEAAIAAGDADEAIAWLELARSRYLDAVMRERSGRRDDAPAPASTWEAGAAQVDLTASLAWLQPNTAVLWCGAFPAGLGLVVVRRHGETLVRRCAFHPDIGSAELVAWFGGSAGRLVQAHRAGRAVEAIAYMAAEPAAPAFGADAFWQSRGEAWNESLAWVVTRLRERVWPRLLELVGAPVAQIVLLPSVGCSELPLTAAAPDTWATGDALAVGVAPSLAALRGETPALAHDSMRLVQIDNPGEDEALACCVIEAAAVRRHTGAAASVLRGRRATPERVAAAFNEACVVHFMGHATCDWREPLDSALVCATRDGAPTRLRVRDLLHGAAPVAARVVVLSVCTIGHVLPGDKRNDFINLPSALVAAGAGCVLAPRWQVDDLAASMWTAHWFEQWREGGLAPGAALAATRRWLRDDVTRELAERWLDGVGAVGAVRGRLQAIQKRLVAQFAAHERPFANVAHWGAFEMTGQPHPYGEPHA